MINAPALHIFICCTFSPQEPGLCTFALLLTVFFPAVTAQWRDPSTGTGCGMLCPKAMLLVLVSIVGQDLVFGLCRGWQGLGDLPSLCTHRDPLLVHPCALCLLPAWNWGRLPVSPSAALPAQPQSPRPPPPLPGPLRCPDLGTAGTGRWCRDISWLPRAGGSREAPSGASIQRSEPHLRLLHLLCSQPSLPLSPPSSSSSPSKPPSSFDAHTGL